MGKYDMNPPNRSYNDWDTVEQQLLKRLEEEGYTKSETDALLALKADKSTVEEKFDDLDDTDDYLENKLFEDEELITELQEGLENKVDKEDGKGLSSNDFTDGYKVQISDNTNRIGDAETRLSGHDADVTRIDADIDSLDATKADQTSLEEETQARLEAEEQLQGQIDDKADTSDLNNYIKKDEIQDDGAIELGPNGLRVKVDGQTIVIANGFLKCIVQPQGGGGNAYWGGITGDINAQADLLAELKKKITYGSDVPPGITQALRNTIYVYTGPTTEEEPIYINSHIYYSAEVTVEGVTEWKWIDITAGWLKPLEEKDAEQDVRMTNIEAKDTEQDSAITQLQADLQDEIDDRTGGDEALASRISAVENAMPNKEDKSNKVTNLSASSTNEQYPTALLMYNEGRKNEVSQNNLTGKTREDLYQLTRLNSFQMVFPAVQFTASESPNGSATSWMNVRIIGANASYIQMEVIDYNTQRKWICHRTTSESVPSWDAWKEIVTNDNICIMSINAREYIDISVYGSAVFVIGVRNCKAMTSASYIYGTWVMNEYTTPTTITFAQQGTSTLRITNNSSYGAQVMVLKQLI